MIIATRERGRPIKRTRENAQRICEAIAKGMPLKYAVAAAGIASYQTFCDWRRDDAQFAAEIEAAIAQRVEHHLQLIQKAAEMGDWRAAAWMLERTSPEHFARTRLEIEHSGTVNHEFTIAPETLNEIAAARRRIEQERLLPST